MTKQLGELASITTTYRAGRWHDKPTEPGQWLNSRGNYVVVLMSTLAIDRPYGPFYGPGPQKVHTKDALFKIEITLEDAKPDPAPEPEWVTIPNTVGKWVSKHGEWIIVGPVMLMDVDRWHDADRWYGPVPIDTKDTV
jgi:hypothetical protein